MDEIKVRREGNEMVYEMRVKIGEGSMLEQEQAIQDAVNRVGGRATADALKRFDTQGKAISVDGVKFTTKGEQTEEYECPFGKIGQARLSERQWRKDILSDGARSAFDLEFNPEICQATVASLWKRRGAFGGGRFEGNDGADCVPGLCQKRQ